jgi:hypothetical protein
MDTQISTENGPALKTKWVNRTVSNVLVLVVGILLAMELSHWKTWSKLNADEGFYLAASRATLKGDLPYFDYAYTQGPFLPLLNAPLAAVVPPSLEGIRTISMLWTAAGFLAAYLLFGGVRHPLVAAGGLAILLFSQVYFSFMPIGKTYALAQFLLLLAAAGLLLPGGWRRRLVWLSVFGVLCAGTRLTLAPVVAGLWMGLWWLHRREARASWMLLVPAATVLLLIGPFAFPDPSRFLFWNYGYHAAGFSRHPPDFWTGTWSLAPGVWTLGLAALTCMLKNEALDRAGLVFLLAGAAGLAFNLFCVGLYPEYATPFVLLILVGSGRVLYSAGLKTRRMLVLAGVILAVAIATGGKPAVPPGFTPDTPPVAIQARQAAQFLREHTAPGDEVLAAMPEIAIEAGRPLYRNLVMGKFAVTTEIAPERAAHLHVLTFDELTDAVERCRPAAVVGAIGPRWNFFWTIPSLRPAGEAQARFWSAVERHYSLAYSDDTYVILLRGPTADGKL